MPPNLLTRAAPLSVPTLVINLLLDAGLSTALAWYFLRYGTTLSNRASLARIIPFISLTTVLIISVVKSSLALSLGLVGALSIVRFRTPIKEPEELAYLFMAIALGLGLGADQRLPTAVAFFVVLGVLMVQSRWRRGTKSHNLYLNIEMPDTEEKEPVFETTKNLLAEHVEVADLRRLDRRDGMIQATFSIGCRDDQALVGLMDSLKKNLSGAAITMIDQNRGIEE